MFESLRLPEQDGEHRGFVICLQCPWNKQVIKKRMVGGKAMECVMIVGKIVGSVVATRKNEKLIGSKFLIVEPLEHMQAQQARLVAVDNVGAGIGEIVLVALGSAARVGCSLPEAPIDAAIVGIVDDAIGLE